MKPRKFDLRSQLEEKLIQRKVEEQKRHHIVKTLEYLAGDSFEAKMLRLARPTDSSFKKKTNNVKYAKQIKEK